MNLPSESSSLTDQGGSCRADAFADFDRRYRQHVLGYVRWAYPDVDADDIAQEVLLRAYTSFDDPSAILRPERWVRLVARRIIIDQARRRPPKREIALDLVAEADFTHSAAGPADTVAAREEIRWLAEVLAHAPDAERQLIHTMLRDGATCAQAARTLGITPAAARQQVHRFRQRLESAFAAHGPRVIVVSIAGWWLGRRRGGGHQASSLLSASTAAVATAGFALGVVTAIMPGESGAARAQIDSTRAHVAIESAQTTTTSTAVRPPRGMSRAQRDSSSHQSPGLPEVSPYAQVSTSPQPLEEGQTFRVEVRVPTPVGTFYFKVYDDKSGRVCDTLPASCG